jgi:hypothetical protein
VSGVPMQQCFRQVAARFHRSGLTSVEVCEVLAIAGRIFDGRVGAGSQVHRVDQHKLRSFKMNVVPLRKSSSSRLQCSVCGMEASCDCGAPYVMPGERAAAAVAKNPEKSDRAIATDLGVSTPTVSRARKSSTVTNVTVEPRTGKDGRTRKMPTQRNDPQRGSTTEIAPPAVLVENILYSIGGVNENARIFNKLLKLSALDREAKVKIIAAIDGMMKKWRSIQSTLGKKE